jgi:hypothetical protein
MPRPVRIGQRYRSTEAPACVWEVADVIDLNRIQHAVLVLVRDPHTRKTVSMAGLANRSAFEFVAEPTDTAEAGWRR